MKSLNVLVLSTSSNNTHTFLGSLECLGVHNLSVLRYDQKWHEAAFAAIQQDPANQQRIQTRQMTIPRAACAMDDAMLLEAKIGRPDAIVYISAWQEDFCPLNETLGELNSIAPLIHFLSDGADPPWWPQLQEFERRGVFRRTVSIDGNHAWPGGDEWSGDWSVSNGLTLLTPIDTRYFPEDNPLDFAERPYPIGYAGNQGGHIRSAMVRRMQAVRGFAFRERDTFPNSYPAYADFLRHCQVQISVPFSGSGAKRQVKGRVLESGFAGCALLEWENVATAAWFTPRFEYEEFTSIEEAAQMAEWLAAHPRRSEDMAAALRHRVTTEHSPAAFWGKVLEGIGE